MAPAVFSATNLTCIRGERIVFQDLSFEVSAGSALLLRGPNGTGKSSLLRLCAGFLQPSEGELRWNAAPIADDLGAHHARSAWVGHLDAVKPAFSVAENIGFWLRLNGAGPHPETALAALGLGHLASLPAAYLSAGQRRRLNLARLAGTTAPLWLLDEPTSSLDDASARALLHIIDAHCNAGGMAIIATHHDLDLTRVSTLQIGRPTDSGGVNTR